LLYLVPGTLLLLVVAISTIGFARRLSSRVRNLLGLGAAVWVFGAVVLEFVEVAADDLGGLTFALLGTAQDAFELAGLIIVLDALLHHAFDRGYVTTLTVS
jgi:hypothetical protein